jgi:hypothetical protein
MAVRIPPVTCAFADDAGQPGRRARSGAAYRN